MRTLFELRDPSSQLTLVSTEVLDERPRSVNKKLPPNLRWTSDGFEIACWDGQVVRVAFALDTCDREVMAWCASTGGISGEMIRDLMLEAVEKRFGAPRTPQPIQWLSDNGSCYRAYETRLSLPFAWAWCRALRRYEVRNPMAWQRRS